MLTIDAHLMVSGKDGFTKTTSIHKTWQGIGPEGLCGCFKYGVMHAKLQYVMHDNGAYNLSVFSSPSSLHNLCFPQSENLSV